MFKVGLLSVLYRFVLKFWNSLSEDQKTDIKKEIMQIFEKLFRDYYRKYNKQKNG